MCIAEAAGMEGPALIVENLAIGHQIVSPKNESFSSLDIFRFDTT